MPRAEAGLRRRVPDRLAWAVEQLGMAPDDHVLEIGCGTGVAAELIVDRLVSGHLVAIDRSAPMIRAAARRNRAAILAERATFVNAALAGARLARAAFDRALAVNVNVFWRAPAPELEALRTALRPGGLLCLVYQPPSASKTASIGERCAAFLRDHGFRTITVRTAELAPVRCVSIRARSPR